MKILHLAEKIAQAPPVVPVTNMRYDPTTRTLKNIARGTTDPEIDSETKLGKTWLHLH